MSNGSYRRRRARHRTFLVSRRVCLVITIACPAVTAAQARGRVEDELDIRQFVELWNNILPNGVVVTLERTLGGYSVQPADENEKDDTEPGIDLVPPFDQVPASVRQPAGTGLEPVRSILVRLLLRLSGRYPGTRC